MLEELPWIKLLEWMVYNELEPFGEIREDYRSASVRQTFTNVMRSPVTYPQPFPLDDFLLKFGDSKQELPSPAQTVAAMEAHITSWCKAHNSSLKKQG